MEVSDCFIIGTQCRGELMGLRAGLDIVERRNILQKSNNSLVIHPTA
jgi:hypothetical protein